VGGRLGGRAAASHRRHAGASRLGVTLARTTVAPIAMLLRALLTNCCRARGGGVVLRQRFAPWWPWRGRGLDLRGRLRSRS
jgi:hypothetical protein